MADPTHRWTWERQLRERSANEGLSKAAQHVALMMATYADPAGDGIYPSVDKLCKDTGRSRSAVTSLLAELRESGWVTQVERGNNLKKSSSRYVLSIPSEEGQPAGP